MDTYTASIVQNLIIMFVLVPVSVFSWWFLVKFINRSVDANIRQILHKIYENPIAAAIYRVGLMFTVAQLIIAAYGRII